jgi:predicted unusual protein kinase regulating ubiquinone biosynthesis (AarF/ABC1/UbiB family)
MAKLKKIREGALSRGWALARVSMSAGAKAASHAVGTAFSSDEAKAESLKAMVLSQVGMLARELGQLKGSVMKVGQMLSMYGEHFLPPEANKLLKSLQSQSPPLEWAAIERQLKRQLGPEALEAIEIDPEPLASASLGQVHKARRKSDGRELAVKVQYPGVDQAIEGDLKALKSILSVSKLIPRGPALDDLFKEVRQMLHQEVDYSRELELTGEFRQALANDPRLIIPETFAEFSGKRVLTTSFEAGIPVDSPEVLGLPQERRDALARLALELYFRELFDLGMMQTDPHFGNYRVRLGEHGQPDRLVLLDFGAVRKFPRSFLVPYRRMVIGAYHQDKQELWKGATELGFLKEGDSEAMLENFAAMCFMISEPFHAPAYDWRASDLPKRVAALGAQLAFSFKLRTPPRELVFLDRKLGGIFIFMSVLGAKFDATETLEECLKSTG